MNVSAVRGKLFFFFLQKKFFRGNAKRQVAMSRRALLFVTK